METTFIECIVDILDADHSHDICSRLDASIYGILIQIILQAEDCKEGERVFYLLAVSTSFRINVFSLINKGCIVL